MKVKVYISKHNRLAGTSRSEVMREARKMYRTIQGQTKRLPYVRSRYFQKEKVFLNTFWKHLNKNGETIRLDG